jgi:hypothetical protein
VSWVLAIGESAPRVALWQHATAGAFFVAVSALTYAWWPRVRQAILKREEYYDRVLRGHLLMDVKPRSVTMIGLACMLLLALIGYMIVPSVAVAVALAAVAAFLPTLALKYFRYRRLYRLEDQLVDGIRTLTSGVRAGLNLIQAMDLLARNAVRPISEEFTHLVREYEHGISLEQAMANAGRRIGSPNYRLVFSALLTHRERGGDLGDTLERIAESIREIHRLEKRDAHRPGPDGRPVDGRNARGDHAHLLLHHPRGRDAPVHRPPGKDHARRDRCSERARLPVDQKDRQHRYLT